MRGPSDGLTEAVPNGLFSLELPGSQGSHRGHSGILQGDPQMLVILDDLQPGGKGVLDVLHDPETAAFVEMKIQRLANHGFTGNNVHLQTISDGEVSQRLFRGRSRRVTGSIDAFPSWSEGFDEFLNFRTERPFVAGRL
jgi:hypothetical protein